MSRTMSRALMGVVVLATVAALGSSAQDAPTYRDHAVRCLDTLMEHGRDVYGPVKTPVLVSILDVTTLTCPPDPAPVDEPWRVIRRHRRNPAGADLATDMPTLTLMRSLGGKYETFAREYATYYLTNMVSTKTKLLCWGWHDYYDVFKDECHFDQHELHAGIDPIDWEFLWSCNPDAVRRQVEATWEWHVFDKSNGTINRHGDGKNGCNFSMSAGSYIEAFAFMFAKTGEQVWADRALLLADHYWTRRNPDTNLFPEQPNAGADRFDGSHFVTACAGPHCGSLLYAHALTKDARFRDYALAYLTAYSKYGYDKEAGAYWGSLELDGTPNDKPVDLEGYAKYEPRGHLDLWEPYIAGYQYPIYTGATYLKAAQETKNTDMLVNARRFADWVIRDRPGKAGIRAGTWYSEYTASWASQGTYAGKYGRAIALLSAMHQETGEDRYLDAAREYADEAIAKLYVNGLFKGHPAKPYYEAVDGVGYLLQALVDLEACLQP
ncbi:MAG: hypothetical protein GY851_36905 [bacterium]|nr:hypothetical protein [bacterium]